MLRFKVVSGELVKCSSRLELLMRRMGKETKKKSKIKQNPEE